MRDIPAVILLDFGVHAGQVGEVERAAVDYGRLHCKGCTVIECTAYQTGSPAVISEELFNAGSVATGGPLSPSRRYRVKATIYIRKRGEDFIELLHEAACQPKINL